MKRSLLIVVLVVLSAAGFVTPSTGFAQFGPPASGITVTGTGIATAEAESAEFHLALIDEQAFMGPPPAQQAEATPGAAARESAAPVVDAAEGVEGVDTVTLAIPAISNPFFGPAPVAVLTVTMTGPTQENVSALITAASQAAIGSNLMLGYVGALFTTSDCASLVQEANAAALGDATSQAGDQASMLGVGLGEVVGISSAGYGFGAYGQPQANHGCETVPPTGFGGPFPIESLYPQFDPSLQEVEVEVVRQLTVTFAIAATEATPAG